MTFSYLVIVLVMCGRNFNHTRSKIHSNVCIGDDGDFTLQKRQFNFFAYESFVTLIVGMYHDRCIAEVGFRSCCCNFHMPTSISERVLDIVKFTVMVFVLNLDVTQCTVMRTPVHHVVSTNNKSLIIKMDKGFFYRLLKPLVHSETLSLPCRRYAHLTQLLCHDACRFSFPSPNTL